MTPLVVLNVVQLASGLTFKSKAYFISSFLPQSLSLWDL